MALKDRCLFVCHLAESSLKWPHPDSSKPAARTHLLFAMVLWVFQAKLTTDSRRFSVFFCCFKLSSKRGSNWFSARAFHGFGWLHLFFDALFEQPRIGRVARGKSKPHGDLHHEPEYGSGLFQFMPKNEEGHHGHPAVHANLPCAQGQGIR